MKKWVKKHIGILVIIIIASVYALILINSYLLTYKFGINKTEYPQFFSNQYNEMGLNKDLFHVHEEANQNSSLTEIILPDGTNNHIITVEHLVKVQDVDKKIIPELKSTNYLFSAVGIPFSNISNIEIKHSYNGQELEEVGTYIYRFDDNDAIKEVININQISDISLEKNYAIVKIYELPKLQKNMLFQIFIPKNFWFANQAEQKISIEYVLNVEVREANYTFKLYWFLSTSFWERLLTVT